MLEFLRKASFDLLASVLAKLCCDWFFAVLGVSSRAHRSSLENLNTWCAISASSSSLSFLPSFWTCFTWLSEAGIFERSRDQAPRPLVIARLTLTGTWPDLRNSVFTIWNYKQQQLKFRCENAEFFIESYYTFATLKFIYLNLYLLQRRWTPF